MEFETPGLITSLPKDEFSEVPNEGNKPETRFDFTPPVVEVTEVQETKTDLEILKEKLEAAHESLKGEDISNISISHSYWGLMNEARQFQLSKGLK